MNLFFTFVYGLKFFYSSFEVLHGTETVKDLDGKMEKKAKKATRILLIIAFANKLNLSDFRFI